MDSGKITNKLIGDSYPPGKKSTEKKALLDSYQKNEAPSKLDADVMKELQKILSVSTDLKASEVIRLERPMTENEKVRFKTYFPKLDVDKAVVTDEATARYNCIAWSAGITDQWVWPPFMYPNLSEDKAFDKFYASRGFERAETGELARWSNDQGITHGSISGPGHGPRWESKCGQEARIQHGFDELEGEIYGKPDTFYTKAGEPETAMPNRLKGLSEDIKLVVQERALRVDPEVKKKFDGLYTSWQQFQKDPKVCISANPADYCKTESFKEIVKMGGSVIPLLMEKMSRGDIFSLQAVEAIANQVVVPREHLNFHQKNWLTVNRIKLIMH